MRNTFFVQVVLPLATASFCVLHWIFSPTDSLPTPQILFANKPCRSAQSLFFSTGANSGAARDAPPLPLLVTPEQLAHLRYLLSRPNARRVPETPHDEEFPGGCSESLDDPVTSHNFSNSMLPLKAPHIEESPGGRSESADNPVTSHNLSNTISKNVSASFTCVNEPVVDSDVSLAADVFDQISIHSPDNGHSNNSILCMQQPLGNTSLLFVTGRAIQSTNSSIEIDPKVTISSAVVDEHIQNLLIINNSHDTSQGSSNNSGSLPALLPIGVVNPAHVHSDPAFAPTSQSMDTPYNDLVTGPRSQPIDTPLVTSNGRSSDSVNITSTSATSKPNLTIIPTISSLLDTRRFAALVSFLNAQFFYYACAILFLVVLSFLLPLKLPVVPVPRREDAVSTSVFKPMPMVLVVLRPADAPPPPRRLQRRFSEPNISYSYATFRTHCTVSGAQVTEAQPAQSTSTLANSPTVEPHVEQPVITPSSSCLSTQTSTTESTAATSVARSPSPLTPQSTVSVNSPRLAQPFTCIPSGSLPTPRADFLTSPSQSFDVFYAAQALEEGRVQPSSSNFTRHGRRSEVFRRRNQEHNYERTGVPVQNKSYDNSRETYEEEGAHYGRIFQPVRRRHTTGRTRRENRRTEEPRYARTAVLVQNRVYDIDDEREGASDDGLGDPSQSVQPSAAASEQSSSYVGLGISGETGGSVMNRPDSSQVSGIF